MPKLVIHQEKVEDPQVLVDICPFGAMEEKEPSGGHQKRKNQERRNKNLQKVLHADAPIHSDLHLIILPATSYVNPNKHAPPLIG